MKKITYYLFAPLVLLVFTTTFLSGLVICPYAPYHQEGAKFVDKLGRPVTADEYCRFELWQDALFVAVIPFAGLAIAGVFWRYWPGGSLWTEQIAMDRRSNKDIS